MGDRENRTFMQSETYKNILATIDGEQKASTRYAIFAEKAKEENYQQIGNIFEETSGNEREHAVVWMKILNGGEIPPTLDNLQTAYQGEHNEWTSLYIGYAETARKEGYPEIAQLYEGIAGIERHHDARFRKLAQNIINGQVFCKKVNTVWICLNCGNLFYGECAPEICPVCGYPQGYYQLNCDNF